MDFFSLTKERLVVVAMRDEPMNLLRSEFIRGGTAPSATSDLENVYPAIMQCLRRRLSLFVWQGFFEPLKLISFNDDTLTLAAPSLFHRDWIQDHYLIEILEACNSVLGRKVEVVLVFDSTLAPEDKASDAEMLMETAKVAAPVAPAPPPSLPASILPLRHSSSDDASARFEISSTPLNPLYSFDTFVPGPSNHMGFAACNAVAEQPGSQYSPLFLFGPVGIGKTHLLHGIGLHALAQNPNARIVYMSAEQWVNAYIQAIRERRFEAFRKRFRTGCDILLIDDIQFLAGKDASQDEFFHTFNSLYQTHKQIVVTSDKYPHEIEGLEERLKTRLSWGLIADIRPPEVETRIAILHRKAESCGIKLPQDVAHYLAAQISSSVRELEGALLRLSAFVTVTKADITLAHAKEYLSPVFRRGTGSVTPERICEYVAAYYDLRSVDLKGSSRQRQVVIARQVAMSLCRSQLALSLPEIGRLFGGRDHTTVLASLRKVDELRESDIGVQSVLARLEKNLVASDDPSR